MPESIQEQINKIRASLLQLEAQRSILGDDTVDTASVALKQQLASLEEQLAVQAAPVEERRMVTILFFDIVGSTHLAEKLDPEEWRQVVSRVHTTLSEAISAHHGTVAQYLGDGLLAIFGSRQVSEHDSENAIRAALDGHAAVSALDLATHMQLRAGIHTGLVVVGEFGDDIHKEFTASGDAMNLAARLQSSAPPGGTLISHDTYRYVRGVFELTPQPPLTVKGKSEPIQTYLVRRAKPRPFRSVARGVAGIETTTIGREQEMQALQAAYQRAYTGHGLVWAQLVSEPGVGKSRLIADMIDWIDLRPESAWLLRGRAFPDDANQPFALIRRMWFDRFQIAEDAPLGIAEAKWVERFSEFFGQEDAEEAAHALGLLVGLPFTDSPYIKAMRDDPIQVKGRALVVSQELFKSVRQQNPIVIFLEDLQWNEPASWEYLMEVFLSGAENNHQNGLFLLGAARPEWQPPKELSALFESSPTHDQSQPRWGTVINLAPLSDQSARMLAQELLQRAVDVPEQVIDLLVERSEGVPYFTEEIVNWFIDHNILDTHNEPWRFLPDRLKVEPLPSTLQHLLLTRLGALSQSERAALQRGAIFGRRFWTGGVEALGASPGAETLSHLQPRGFVEAQPESAFEGDTEWSFHQNLLQEVTYESVLKRERLALHKIAAGWLERQARQAGRLDEFAGLLGDHFERAGELSQAADWYLLAGKRAYSQGAPREASAFYSQALELLPPVDRERRWQALLEREASLSLLSEAALWKANLDACMELARELDNDNYLAEIYFRMAVYGLHTGDYQIIDQSSQAALAAAQHCGSVSIEAKALIMAAIASIHRGDNAAARQQVENGVALARRQSDERTLFFVLYRAAFCYSELGLFTGWYPLYVELIELTHRLGDRVNESLVLTNFGSAHADNGLYKQGRAMLEQSLRINQSIGARRPLAYSLVTLAGIYWHTGDMRKAVQLTEQALEVISPTQDIRGKVIIITGLGIGCLETDDAPGAARRFTEARDLSLAHDLIALAHEATTGLASAEIRQGHLVEAQKLTYEAWDYIREKGWSEMAGPGWAILNIIEAFDALGDHEGFQAALDYGHQALLQVVETKYLPLWRQSFLENIPEHRRIIELWERHKQSI